MNATHRRPPGALAALSLLGDPLADVGGAVPELEALGFALCQKLHSLTVDQFDLCEIDGNDVASVERGANDLQVLRCDPTADVKDHTLFGGTSVERSMRRTSTSQSGGG